MIVSYYGYTILYIDKTFGSIYTISAVITKDIT